MEKIQIMTSSRTVGERLYTVLYQAGFPDVTHIRSLHEHTGGHILLIYQRERIPELLTSLTEQKGTENRRVIVLLDADRYALHLDRARHAGIRLLLMPVAPYCLLEAVEACQAGEPFR